MSQIDDLTLIDGRDALRCSRELAAQEGLFVGISSDATFAGAFKVAKEAPTGSNILCMLPDTGERYLSTTLFEDVASEMTTEETELSHSTRGYRFDVNPPAPEVTAVVQSLDARAIKEVEALTHDKSKPVIMFAYEWCEFCNAARKVFAKYAIPYLSIELDSIAYQIEGRGDNIFKVLQQQTGSVTLPQIFIGGEFMGGCMDILDNLRSGQLQIRLQQHGINIPPVTADPYEHLPKWLHPR